MPLGSTVGPVVGADVDVPVGAAGLVTVAVSVPDVGEPGVVVMLGAVTVTVAGEPACPDVVASGPQAVSASASPAATASAAAGRLGLAIRLVLGRAALMSALSCPLAGRPGSGLKPTSEALVVQ
jgi:hypothetical protein